MKTFSFGSEIKFREAGPAEVLEADLNSIKIADQVQLLRTGSFFHEGAQLQVTKEMLAAMVKNFQANVRGIDIAVDYKHDNEDIAAGWIRDLFLSEEGDELWANVQWTPRGTKKLGEKEFRYLSAEFTLNYKDNESLEEFGPTLLGAGLTNRPVVKRMRPAIELSESDQSEGELNMEDQKELKARIEALEAENKKLSEAAEAAEKASLQEGMSPEEMMAKIKELEALLEQMKKEKESALREKEELAAQKALSEKNKAFDTLMSEGKACEAQREAYLKNDMLKFAENAKGTNLEGKGHGDTGSTDKTAEDRIMELAEEKVAKKECADLGQAISVVLSENEKLRADYEA